MDAIVDKQSQLNRSTRTQWHLYGSHRQELERLLIPDRPGQRIGILGAGNCNDLDLRWMTGVYREIHLVDIDGEALARAVKLQRVADSPRIKLRAPVDLTGVADRLATWRKTPPAADEVKGCAGLAAAAEIKLPKTEDHGPSQLTDPGPGSASGQFDIVLSPCVLSQLITPLRDSIGEDHPGFMPLLAAVRARHLRLMLDLLSPGGRGVLACDLLSSGTFPDLARVPKDRAADFMGTMLSRGKCFSGLEPRAMAEILRRDCRAIDVRPVEPWIWHLGLSKSYLVYALTFRRMVSI
ncbi:MAG TPA: hypothetical protein VFE47_11535 [Tepidisphaeraceae bacterium]|jgi:hypothetical protein|nr:hypothetical protein [Tepidisphaeraceae bacterium]